ncbi:MAG: hypothetical protein J07HX5_00104 [halophilic archaeon J07HX5]|nr:MAG: hypothetical protein J07HX5_00104 [halophilic archaeon J07HX5]
MPRSRTEDGVFGDDERRHLSNQLTPRPLTTAPLADTVQVQTNLIDVGIDTATDHCVDYLMCPDIVSDCWSFISSGEYFCSRVGWCDHPSGEADSRQGTVASPETRQLKKIELECRYQPVPE